MAYEMRTVLVEKETPLYAFCSDLCMSARKLYNTALSIELAVYTSIGKETKNLDANQKAVLDSIRDNLDKMNATVKKQEKEPRYKMPSPQRPFLNYGFMSAYMHVTENSDFYNETLGEHIAKSILKDVVNACMNFLNAVKAYAANPSSFFGKPELPKYLNKDELHTVTVPNDRCVLTTIEKLRKSRFEHVKEAGTGCAHSDEVSIGHENNVVFFNGTTVCCDIGKLPGPRRIMEVKIQPYYDIFRIRVHLSRDLKKHSMAERNSIKTQENAKIEALKDLFNENPVRACSIDFGVNNFAAITNNVGAECILFQVRRIKANNQYYNKKMRLLKSKRAIANNEKQNARQSEETVNEMQTGKPESANSADNKTEDFGKETTALKQAGTRKPRKRSANLPVEEQIVHLSIQRDCKLEDWFHKIADTIICWCKMHSIRVIIVGRNKGWKQKVNMGRANNQKFVYIPYVKFIGMLRYRAEREGIYLHEQEESYTSQASFLDNDPIPTYHKGDTTVYKFSGVRGPTVNAAGMKKPVKANGKVDPHFRGWYRTAKGKYINADLNASANIGRKALPRMFIDGQMPDFDKVIIIKNPDEAKVKLGIRDEPEKKLRKEPKNSSSLNPNMAS